MRNPRKCSRRKALYNELVNDWDELNLHFKALMIIGIIIISSLFFNIYLNILSDETKELFTSTILSIFGFLLSGKKDYKNIDTISRIKKDCNKEIEEYNFNSGNLVQIIISIFLINISIISIIFSDLTKNYSLFYFFSDLINFVIGFLLGESKIKNKI